MLLPRAPTLQQARHDLLLDCNTVKITDCRLQRPIYGTRVAITIIMMVIKAINKVNDLGAKSIVIVIKVLHEGL